MSNFRFIHILQGYFLYKVCICIICQCPPWWMFPSHSCYSSQHLPYEAVATQRGKVRMAKYSGWRPLSSLRREFPRLRLPDIDVCILSFVAQFIHLMGNYWLILLGTVLTAEVLTKITYLEHWVSYGNVQTSCIWESHCHSSSCLKQLQAWPSTPSLFTPTLSVATVLCDWSVNKKDRPSSPT